MLRSGQGRNLETRTQRREPSIIASSYAPVTPDDLRKEAAATELMARVVSYLPDKQWLTAKAVELRRLAERLEARSWEPQTRPDPAPGSRRQ